MTSLIVSASYRTDIPAFYGRWFLNRLEAGFCRVANPYGGPASLVSLAGADVDGFVFWTKNLAPFMPVLGRMAAEGRPFIVQYSITGQPRPLEQSVPDAERAIACLQEVRARYGPRAAVWRYDPIAVTTLTPPEWHIATFSRLAGALRGVTDEVTVSFLEPYAKTRRNLATAARTHGFSWIDPPTDEKQALILRLTEMAAEHGIRLTLCTQPELGRVDVARCIDGRRLSDVAGREISASTKGNRPGCFCAESRDIGAYDTCPHGCVYCYAVANRAKAQQRFQAHDPGGEFLFEPLRERRK